MLHCFDSNVAKEYGVNAAVLLQRIGYWVEYNKANNKNFHDGRYWTYNSAKAFTEQFPFMTANQINYALRRLIDDGVVCVGNYNSMPFDRTSWYALTDKGYALIGESKQSQIPKAPLVKNQNSDFGNFTNEISEISETNTNNITDNKTTNKNEGFITIAAQSCGETAKTENGGESEEKGNAPSSKKPKKQNRLQKLIADYAKEDAGLSDALYRYFRSGVSVETLELNLPFLEPMARRAGMSEAEYVLEIVRRGYKRFYDLSGGQRTEVREEAYVPETVDISAEEYERRLAKLKEEINARENAGI